MSKKRVRSAKYWMRKRWEKMLAYCNDPSQKTYKYVGGIGIRVCDRWVNSFEDYLTDVGYAPAKDMFLERVDKSKNFEPDNVRWVNKTELVNNTHVVTRVMFNGQNLTLKELSAFTDVPYVILCARIKEGLSVEDAMTRPIRNDVQRRVVYLGREMTLAELSREVHMSVPVLYSRIVEAGYTVEEAIAKPVRKRAVASTLKMYSYNDRTQSAAEWSAELGIPYQTLITRLRRYEGDMSKAANHVRGTSTRPKVWLDKQQ